MAEQERDKDGKFAGGGGGSGLMTWARRSGMGTEKARLEKRQAKVSARVKSRMADPRTAPTNFK